MFRVTIDEAACEGIFACLVRDDRFVEGDEGLAGFDPDAAIDLERDDGRITAIFAEGRERAEQAAAACPPNAITVEGIGDEDDGADATDPREATGCR